MIEEKEEPSTPYDKEIKAIPFEAAIGIRMDEYGELVARREGYLQALKDILGGVGKSQ